MPEAESSRPRVATCEDWDEETETALPGSRTSAKATVKVSDPQLISKSLNRGRQHDDNDSGYASKAGTLNSESTGRENMDDSRLEYAVKERERQPYIVSQPHPEPRRQASSKTKDSTASGSTVKVKRIRHKAGACSICDHFGEHIEPSKEKARFAGAEQSTSSSRGTKVSSGKGVKHDAPVESKIRGQSSKHHHKSLSMNTPTAATQLPYHPGAPIYGAPMMVTSGWATPSTPTVQYSPATYSYTTPTGFYTTLPMTASYFDTVPATPDAHLSRQGRRSSTHGDTIEQYHRRSNSRQPLEHVSSNNDPRSSTASHRPHNRNTEDDRKAMPPPPPPAQAVKVDIARRPSVRKSATYMNESKSRRMDDDDDEEYPISRPSVSQKGRQTSPSRPPTSYRAPERPQQMRKAESYSTPVTAKASSSNRNSQTFSRHTRTLSTPLERQEAAAEEYQRERSSMTTRELTAEALKDMKKHQKQNSQSETGSSYSHRSHQSSKDSSGRDRSYTSGARTNIVLDDGVNISLPAGYLGRKGRPISINLGNVILSVKTEEDDRDDEKKRDQKRLEGTPSDTSRVSRRSMTSSLHASSRDKIRDQDVPRQSLSHPKYVDELPSTTKSGRQHSRASSHRPEEHEYLRRPSEEYRYAEVWSGE